MPKITVHGGPSDERDLPEAPPEGQRVDLTGDKPVVVDTEVLEVDAETVEVEAETLEADEPADYESWLKEDLIVELKRRELPSSGTKEELAERLRLDDTVEQ